MMFPLSDPLFLPSIKNKTKKQPKKKKKSTLTQCNPTPAYGPIGTVKRFQNVTVMILNLTVPS